MLAFIAQPNATPLPKMLITQQEQHSILPQRIVYDSAAGPGKLRREVNETTYDHTQIIAPLHLSLIHI